MSRVVECAERCRPVTVVRLRGGIESAAARRSLRVSLPLLPPCACRLTDVIVRVRDDMHVDLIITPEFLEESRVAADLCVCGEVFRWRKWGGTATGLVCVLWPAPMAPMDALHSASVRTTRSGRAIAAVISDFDRKIAPLVSMSLP